MSFKSEVYDRTSGFGAVDTIVDGRVYPTRIPADPTFPLIIFTGPVSDDDGDSRTHDNKNLPTTRTVSRVQFECYAETAIEASALADAIEACWSGYSTIGADCYFGYCFKANRIATRHDSLDKYLEIVDVMMEHETP